MCRPLCSHLRTASSHQRRQPLQRSGTRGPRPAGIARFRQGSPRFCMVSALCCQGAKAPIQHRRHQKHGDLKIVQTLRTKPAHSLLRTRQRCLPGNINNSQGAAENSGFVRLRPVRIQKAQEGPVAMAGGSLNSIKLSNPHIADSCVRAPRGPPAAQKDPLPFQVLSAQCLCRGLSAAPRCFCRYSALLPVPQNVALAAYRLCVPGRCVPAFMPARTP